MDIDVLINILEKAKNDELYKVKIFTKGDDDCFYSEDISGFSYDFKNDCLIIFPHSI